MTIKTTISNGDSGLDVRDTLNNALQDIAFIKANGGEQGAKGDKGDKGDSAYQVALSNGFVGTQTQWLASLKGAQGIKGDTGLQGGQGIQGNKGDKGDTGNDGQQGTPGESAYQIAVDNGFVGTQADWIASLKGDKGNTGDVGPTGPGLAVKGVLNSTADLPPSGNTRGDGYIIGTHIWIYDGTTFKDGGPFKGDKGDTGQQGQQGQTGATGLSYIMAGANGKSAYQVAVDNGFQGTVQQWLDSLKGEDGTGVIHSTDDVPEGQYNLYFNVDRARSAFIPGTGITIDQATGTISGASTLTAGNGITITNNTISSNFSDFRELWVHDFYGPNVTTDVQAIQAAFAYGMTQSFSDMCIKFAVGKGKGPNGRYQIDQEIQFNTNYRLVLDFGEATVLFTQATSCFNYIEQQNLSGSLAAKAAFFVVRGGVHHYYAGVQYMFKWNMWYNPARVGGTGYAENMRICQHAINTTPTHTVVAPFYINNAWYFSTTRVHFMGPSVLPVISGVSFIYMDGVSVVVFVDKCEIFYADVAIRYGYGLMTGMDVTYGPSSGFSFGKQVVQPSTGAVGYMARGDGGYGYNISLSGPGGTTDTSGTFALGSANILNVDGSLAGTMNITRTGKYYQPCEAVQIGGGSTFVSVNYIINWTSPGPGVNILDLQISDCHCAPFLGVVKGDGMDHVMIHDMSIMPLASPCTVFDFNNTTQSTIHDIQSTTNVGHTAGTMAYKFVKLRNCYGISVHDCTLVYYDTPWDIDNTVKDSSVHHMNNGALTSGMPVSTANRYQGNQTRGIRYYSNGAFGASADAGVTAGLDLDDLSVYSTTSLTIGSQNGTISSQSNSMRWTIQNGILSIQGLVNITARGNATGNLYIYMPNSIKNRIPNTTMINACVNTSAAITGFYNSSAGRFEINGDYTADAFLVSSTYGNYSYFFACHTTAGMA